MKSSKLRFTPNKKKKWPIVVTVIIGSILIIVPVIWIGLHNWNLDKSIAALNLEQQADEPSQIIPETPVEPPEEPKESPKPPVEKPSNNRYDPNQKYPEVPTVKNGFIVANKQFPLPVDYNNGEDPLARTAFNKMAAAAKLDGFELVAFSTFRSFERQETLYNQYVEKDGQQAADQYSARPGYSEHQTGLSFDIGEKNFEQHWAAASFGETPAGEWISQNAHLYGFILRYPLGKEEVTGYMHESWHFRYVGVEPATDMFTHKQTLEEYLDL
ncbi:D-alanyl-D-alanine carboxypeptidase family protein [Paenisporosarcina sp. OV554]|uniref:M15 family metallopeptidase n=1 Tax=Paenisporosarcina sp. OV554 TaxID=2135694 RepID=UPI000D3353A5|nr:M15 family metallopeptidase [Paenisporosarcina sp. OV554]PUB14501.1 D-alanyl-D-alanine carboxypeptidase [Paenisporosarcina sp. OV554]